MSAKRLQNRRPTYESPTTREERRRRGVSRGGAPFATSPSPLARHSNKQNGAWDLFRQRLAQGNLTPQRTKETTGTPRRTSEPVKNQRQIKSPVSPSPRAVRFSGNKKEDLIILEGGKRVGRKTSVPARITEPRQNRSSLLRMENNLKILRKNEEKERLANINRHSRVTPRRESGKNRQSNITPLGSKGPETGVNVVPSKSKRGETSKETFQQLNTSAVNKNPNISKGPVKQSTQKADASQKNVEAIYGKRSSMSNRKTNFVVTPEPILAKTGGHRGKRKNSLEAVRTVDSVELSPDAMQHLSGVKNQRKQPDRRLSLSESQTIFGRIDTTESLQGLETIKEQRKEKRSRSLIDFNSFQSIQAIQMMNEALFFGKIPKSKSPPIQKDGLKADKGRGNKKSNHKKGETQTNDSQGSAGDKVKNVGTKTKSTKKRQSGDDKLVSAPALLIEPTPSLGEISDQEAAVEQPVMCEPVHDITSTFKQKKAAIQTTLIKEPYNTSEQESSAQDIDSKVNDVTDLGPWQDDEEKQCYSYTSESHIMRQSIDSAELIISRGEQGNVTLNGERT
ncbi:uncharacterized protein LOC142342595 isoform X2 [Convolutriloba macropyga]|uniref:uncharacterized protein LOC142342595 isoform X2 n=1 Tax=Convolutriloba macropyga TaxID=536237 RepID=UPI003F528ECC